jgi:hypothetical protein
MTIKTAICKLDFEESDFHCSVLAHLTVSKRYKYTCTDIEGFGVFYRSGGLFTPVSSFSPKHSDF